MCKKLHKIKDECFNPQVIMAGYTSCSTIHCLIHLLLLEEISGALANRRHFRNTRSELLPCCNGYGTCKCVMMDKI